MKLKIFLSALLLSATTILTSCTTVADLTGNSTQALNAQASQVYVQTIEQAKEQGMLDTTSPTAQRVMRVFNNMKPYAEAANKTGTPFNWEMHVIRTDDMNAWAMPGGKMAVYTGMVEKLNLTDGELAAVIGHEMTHALHEHAKKDRGQKVLTGLAAGAVGTVLSAYTKTDLSSITQLAANIGVDKPFSRSQETDADMGGLYLMAQAGYNPEEAVNVWLKMNQAKGKQGLAVSILSTHPTNDNRIESIRNELPKVMPVYQNSRIKH